MRNTNLWDICYQVHVSLTGLPSSVIRRIPPVPSGSKPVLLFSALLATT